MPQTITVKLENGSPTIYQNPNPGDLAFGDQVPLTLAGFPSGAKVTAVSVYTNVTKNGSDAKGDLIGTWKSSDPGVEPETELGFSVDDKGVVTIEDTDETADGKLWYGVTVTAGVQSWTVDPELIVKKKE